MFLAPLERVLALINLSTLGSRILRVLLKSLEVADATDVGDVPLLVRDIPRIDTFHSELASTTVWYRLSGVSPEGAGLYSRLHKPEFHDLWLPNHGGLLQLRHEGIIFALTAPGILLSEALLVR